MAHLYKRYMRLLDKWPLDKNKSPDLGQYIRDQIKVSFPKGERSEIKDEKECLRQLESLERLASNVYGKKYPVNLKNTATGLKLDILSAGLTPEFIQYAREQKKTGFFAKIRSTISYYSSRDDKEEETPKK